MKEKKDEPLPSISEIPKATATSTSTSESSVILVQPPPLLPPDSPDDLSVLLNSVFSSLKNQPAKASRAKGSTKSNSTATTIPDWQQWWNDINKDAEVSFIFNSGIKSILNGAYKIASQRVYDTAVRKKSSTAKASVVSTPTISNSQRRSNGMVHPERRSHILSRDMSHDFPQQNEYYRHNHTRYNHSVPHPQGAMRNENPRQHSSRGMRMDDMQPNLPRRGANDCYSSGWSHSNRRESQHNRHYHDKHNYSDDDSHSYSSRGRHYHRYHDRKPHDHPYPKEDRISAHENDHRSLASSISTKPQTGIPITYDVANAKRHRYAHEEFIEREHRHHHHHQRRRRSSSGSSTSGRTRNSEYSGRRKNHRRSHDDYERDHHKRYDYDDRRHHRRRHDDHIGSYDDTDHGSRRRNRSESPSQRDDASKGRHLLPSSASYRNDRSTGSHSRSKDNSHVRDTNTTFNDQGRNGRILALHEKRSGFEGLVDDRHATRRSVDDGNDRVNDHRFDRIHGHRREELDLRRERKYDETHSRHYDKRSSCDSETQLQKYGKSERDDDGSTAEAASLPIAEVTTNGGNVKDAKKRDRRYSTPSPRKSRKSKHRKSSSHQKSENNSDSDSSIGSNGTSQSNRRSRHHGSSSSRKHRRRDYDGTDSDDNVISSSSPRKRSSRKRRKKGRRSRSTKEIETDNKGLPESDNNGRNHSKVDKTQISSISEKDK